MVTQTPNGYYWTCVGHGRCEKTLHDTDYDKLIEKAKEHLERHKKEG